MTTMALPERAEPARGRTIELVLAHAHLRLGVAGPRPGRARDPGRAWPVSTRSAWSTSPRCAGGPATCSGRARRRRPRWRAAATTRSRSSSPPRRRHRWAGRARPAGSRRGRSPAAPGTIDAIFAGMPRSGVWAPDANEPPRRHRPCSIAARRSRACRTPASRRRHRPRPRMPAAKGPATPVNLGFWDARGRGGRRGHLGARSGARVRAGPVRAHHRGRRRGRLPVRAGAAARSGPGTGRARGDRGRPRGQPVVVRGDAYRLAGHEPEARQAYAIAANGGLPERRSRVRPRPRVKPVVVDDDDDSRGRASSTAR